MRLNLGKRSGMLARLVKWYSAQTDWMQLRIDILLKVGSLPDIFSAVD